MTATGIVFSLFDSCHIGIALQILVVKHSHYFLMLYRNYSIRFQNEIISDFCRAIHVLFFCILYPVYGHRTRKVHVPRRGYPLWSIDRSQSTIDFRRRVSDKPLEVVISCQR